MFNKRKNTKADRKKRSPGPEDTGQNQEITPLDRWTNLANATMGLEVQTPKLVKEEQRQE